MNAILEKVYNHAPVWVQNLACNIEGDKIKRIRYGKNFWRALGEYESHNDWSYDQMCDCRDRQLKKLMRHCYETVPYYHELFDQGGINPESIKTLDDLKMLPILTKDDIKKDPSRFVSSAYANSRTAEISTSGSTGSSLVLHVDPDNIAKQYAIWWRYRRRLGIDFDMWHNEFGSRIIVPPSQKCSPYWRTCIPLKQVMFSAFHGNATTFGEYYRKVKENDFSWIHATPSVIMQFAAFCAEKGLQIGGKLKFITTGAENLYEHQRILLKEAFNVWARTHYGLTEAVANFSEDIEGVMEVDEDFAAVEFVPEEDYCHIVGTSLINYAMPLIRYDTSDICFVSGKIGKRGRIVERIDGRSGDCVFLPNGTKVGTLSALFSETTNIVEAQIHQHEDYSIEIKFVPKNDRYSADIEKVSAMLKARIAGKIDARFVRVDKIPRTARGKLRYIVSDVQR